MPLPLTIFLYPNFACMRPTVSLSRLPASSIPRMSIVHFVLPEHFSSWILRDRR
jgi:hypothetical protein